MDKPPTFDFGAIPEHKPLQFRQCLEVFQPGICCILAAERKPLELLEGRKIAKALVRELAARIKTQVAQLGQALQLLEPFVRDASPVQNEMLQLGQFGNRREASIGKIRTA